MTQEVDALEQQLNEIKTHSKQSQQKKIDLLIQLAWNLRNQDPKHGLELSEEAFALTQSEFFTEAPYEKGYVYSLRNRVYLNCFLGNYDLAISQSAEILDYLQEQQFEDVRVDTWCVVGAVYNYLGNYGDAIELLLKTEKLAEAIKHKWGQAYALNNVALAYAYSREYRFAIKAFEACLQLRRELNDTQGEARALNNLGWVYSLMGEYEAGLPYALASIGLVRKMELHYKESYILDTLGGIYAGLKDDEQALYYFEQAVTASKKTGSKQGEAESLLNLGKIYLRLNPEKAKEMLNLALDLATTIKAKRVIYESHYYLSEYYEQVEDLALAFHHFQQFHKEQQAVINEEAENRVKYLRVLHDTETAQKEAEIYQLKNVALEQEIYERQKIERELKQYQDHLEELVESRTVALTETNSQLQEEIVERQRAEGKLLEYANQLEAQNRELKTFAHIASHDLQEPLRKIQLFSDRLQTKREIILDDAGKKYLTRIQAAAAHSQSLIEALSFYVQVLNDEVSFTAVNLSAVVHQVVEEIKSNQQKQNVDVHISSLPTIEANWNQMILLFYNLLENACKFHQDNEEAKIQIENSIHYDEKAKDCCRILIIDNGIGFDEKYANRIFTIFERVHKEGEFDGTGVGLAMCRRIVEQHSGQISVRSSVGEGTVVELLLPLKQDA